MCYDYNNKEYINIKDNSKSLSFLYNNIIGRIILKIVISKPIRNIYNKYMLSKLSIHKINKFIKNNNINMDEYKKEEYKSFNDFFKRTIKEDKRIIENGLISICDSKMSVYKINNDLTLNIKNSIYTIEELVQDKNIASFYKDGYALVYRLCVDDYHHYIFPDNGKVILNKKIDGVFHTVQPIALKKCKVFSENAREVTVLDTENYGLITYIEVGAMMIGKIVNENIKEFKKGMEKGHFEFGGSTIILLYKKDSIKTDDIILKNTKKDIETIVKMGNRIGE